MIRQLSAKYHFAAIHTADTTGGKVTNRAILSIESEKVHRLYPPCFKCQSEVSDSLTSAPAVPDLMNIFLPTLTLIAPL